MVAEQRDIAANGLATDIDIVILQSVLKTVGRQMFHELLAGRLDGKTQFNTSVCHDVLNRFGSDGSIFFADPAIASTGMVYVLNANHPLWNDLQAVTTPLVD